MLDFSTLQRLPVSEDWSLPAYQKTIRRVFWLRRGPESIYERVGRRVAVYLSPPTG